MNLMTGRLRNILSLLGFWCFGAVPLDCWHNLSMRGREKCSSSTTSAIVVELLHKSQGSEGTSYLLLFR